MWTVLFAFLIFIVVLTGIVFVANRWSSGYVQRTMEQRLSALDQIVNEERIPERWIGRYRKRIDGLQQAGQQEAVARYARLAQKQCLANIEELIRFSEHIKYTDSEDTKRVMLEALRTQKQRWESPEEWNMLLVKALQQPTADEPAAPDAVG